MFTLQRAAGVVTLGFIAYHLYQLRHPGNLPTTPESGSNRSFGERLLPEFGWAGP